MKLHLLTINLLVVYLTVDRFGTTDAQNLTAVLCSARLPTGRGDVSALYDGSDTIYLIGGWDGDSSVNDTFTYSISQNVITAAGQLPVPSNTGSTVMDGHGNIYHIGARNSKDIYQYSTQFQNFSVVSTLPVDNYGMAVIQTDPDTALFFGGVGGINGVFSLDLNTFNVERLAYIPSGKVPWYGTPVIWAEGKRAAYLFPRILETPNVTRFDTSTNQFTDLPVDFPAMNNLAKAVSDGNFGYIIGPFGEDPGNSNAIIQFDPENEDFRIIHIEGHPGRNGFYYGTGAVYVEKLNRIYLFGGITSEGVHDEILYISLDPLK